MQQEKIRTLHIYLEEAEPPTIDAIPQQDQSQQKTPPLTVMCFALVALWCLGVPVTAILLGLAYPDAYDATITKTLTLTLSQHPSKDQLPLYALPTISVTQQATVAATGSFHQGATTATGFITFYNGLFTPQTVPTGTTLTGKSGIAIVTRQAARIPAATATTPPTYGTVSVSAASSESGAAGNIAASDIDQACCGPSILAQNLYAFSGGQDAEDLPELTKADLSTGAQALTAQVSTAISGQAQKETKPGDVLLPLNCKMEPSSNHQAGDEVAGAVITLTETCAPLAYSTADIEKLALRSIAIPQAYSLVSFSAFVTQSNVTAQGGTLRIEAIAYLKRIPRGRVHTISL